VTVAVSVLLRVCDGSNVVAFRKVQKVPRRPRLFRTVRLAPAHVLATEALKRGYIEGICFGSPACPGAAARQAPHLTTKSGTRQMLLEFDEYHLHRNAEPHIRRICFA
jgi:hypothetical protein